MKDKALVGTNGKMLQVILTNPEYSTLPTIVGVPQWRALLDLVVQRSGGGRGVQGQPLHALIDCGTLLEGISNR